MSALRVKPLLHRPWKADPPLPAWTLWNHFHPYPWSPIHHYQLAPTKASFTPASKARSTATSLVPVRPDPMWPANLDSTLWVNEDSLLTACSQRRQIVCEVSVSLSKQWAKEYLKLECEYITVASISKQIFGDGCSWTALVMIRYGLVGIVAAMCQWCGSAGVLGSS